MRYSIGLSNEVLDTITNNDYLFCEDKVISLVSKYYGTGVLIFSIKLITLLQKWAIR